MTRDDEQREHLAQERQEQQRRALAAIAAIRDGADPADEALRLANAYTDEQTTRLFGRFRRRRG